MKPRFSIKPCRILLAGLVWLGIASQAGAQSRGDLAAVELLKSITADDLKDELIDFILRAVPSFPIDLFERLVPTTYGVDAYRIVYHTIDAAGRPTLASGLVAVPVGYPSAAAIVTYHHGTLTDEASIPSNLGREHLIGFAFATDGYVVVMPDYLGFGASRQIVHPYVHAATEASAAIDLMRATRQGAAAAGIPLNGQIFLTGYSQGGHAAVATLREIEAHHANEFTVVMTAPGSGPYNVAGVQYRYAKDNPQYPTPAYLPFILFGYQPIYRNLYRDLSEVFVPPWDVDVPAMFDGTNTVDEIIAMMPVNWEEMFQPAYLEAIDTNPFHPVRRALRDNDLLDFAPRSAILMLYCTGDEQVSFWNAIMAQIYFKWIRQIPGFSVAMPVGTGTHRDCAPLAMIAAKFNFDNQRQ